jgi:hypothetical protein
VASQKPAAPACCPLRHKRLKGRFPSQGVRPRGRPPTARHCVGHANAARPVPERPTKGHGPALNNSLATTFPREHGQGVRLDDVPAGTSLSLRHGSRRARSRRLGGTPSRSATSWPPGPGCHEIADLTAQATVPEAAFCLSAARSPRWHAWRRLRDPHACLGARGGRRHRFRAPRPAFRGRGRSD